MAKLEERELVVMDVLREKGWSTRATARELGVDESTLRYRIRRREAGITDGRSRQAEACAPQLPVKVPGVSIGAGGREFQWSGGRGIWLVGEGWRSDMGGGDGEDWQRWSERRRRGSGGR